MKQHLRKLSALLLTLVLAISLAPARSCGHHGGGYHHDL